MSTRLLWTVVFILLNPKYSSYPTVPCGIGWTILWTPICVHSILMSILSYSPMWDSMDNPMDSYVSTLYSPMWDRMDNPMDSYMCPLYTTQSYVSILSYSPMWDSMDNPMDSYMCPLYPKCPSYPYSPMWDSMDNPMDSYMRPLYPKCPSYPTVPCGIGWTILWTPICVHSILSVHPILQSNVG